MSMQITRLNWDSDFFGFEIGKNIVLNPNDINLTITQPFVLTYIFSSEELVELKVKLVDIKYEYVKSLTNESKDSIYTIEEFSATKYTLDEIKELVFFSGKYSRFRNDKNFEVGVFEELYIIWFNKSLYNSTLDKCKVFIITEKETIAGFVTLDFEDDDNARIGLIATNDQFQGRGYASDLIKACERECIKRNIKQLKVATQGLNEAANKLYQKNNFSLKSKTYIYHHWNK
jgi:dTDP-4-amino-4,6-dideoxy-D-galactose acyltransferase